MKMPFLSKSNYERHGHFIAETKKTIQGALFHLRFLPRFRFTKAQKNLFYFIFDPDFRHPGLADRLKAIVYCYYISKRSGYQYKIVCTHPFPLTDYLEPNLVQWEASESDLEYSLRSTRFFIYTARRTGVDYTLPPDRQFHCYCYKGDDLFYQTGHPYGQHFGELFNELFRPSKALKESITATGLQPRRYEAVHIRFVNALGIAERTKYPTLPREAQEKLIQRCHKALSTIAAQSQLPVYVFSDSTRFLNTLSGLPVHVTDSKGIAHISHTSDKDSVMKTFIDWYLLAQASKVYRFKADELYLTNFPLYAVLTQGTEVEDYEI